LPSIRHRQEQFALDSDAYEEPCEAESSFTSAFASENSSSDSRKKATGFSLVDVTS
jgi:hypothetical protein